MQTVQATAGIVRHLLGAPVIVLGVLFVAYPNSIAAFYANVFRSLDAGPFGWWDEGARGTWFIRIAGLAFAGSGLVVRHGLTAIRRPRRVAG